MIVVRIDSRVRIRPPEGAAGEELAGAIRSAFTHPNPKRRRMQAAKTRGWWSEPVAYATWEEAGGELSVPRGGMGRVREILQSRCVAYRVEDLRAEAPLEDFPAHRVELDPHQVRIVDASEAKQNCIVQAPVGSGKTTALFALASRVRQKVLVVVHSNALAEQWVDRAGSELGIPARAVGRLGDGRKSIGRHLTVGTAKSVGNALASDPTLAGAFGLVIADEVHMFAAPTFYAALDPFAAKYRVGASDDERRKDGKEFLIRDVLGERACEVGDAEVVACGRTMDVEVLVVPTEFRADWYDPRAPSPKAGAPPESRSPDYGRLLAEMGASEGRNAVVDRILAQELGEGRQAIVFGSHRDHCRVLGAMAGRRARSGYLLGGADYRAEFRRTKDGLKEGGIRVAVGTYQACGTGIDLPGVEVGIAATPCLTNRQRFRQARGRVCRRPAGKSTARLYVLWDRLVFGASHVENAASWGSPRSTFVLEGGEWIAAREFLRRLRAEGKAGVDG